MVTSNSMLANPTSSPLDCFPVPYGIVQLLSWSPPLCLRSLRCIYMQRSERRHRGGDQLSSPSVSFLLAIRLFTVIPYICEMHCPANVTMMVAVVLTPNRHQCIANYHRDPSSISGFTSSHQHNLHIPLRPLNKQYLREVGGSATCC